MYAHQQYSSLVSTLLLQHDYAATDEDEFTAVLAQNAAKLDQVTPAKSPLFSRVLQSRTLEELQTDPQYGRMWQTPEAEPEPSRLEIARDQRIQILAMQFEGAVLTREDEARFAILTQRLRRLAPRVTQKSWTIAEDAVSGLEAISGRIDEIGAKYGL